MASVMSIIFIKVEEQLIIEIAPWIKGEEFLKGLRFNLMVESETNEQPIKITTIGKSRVISFLERNYLSEKKMNKLIKFFRDAHEGEKIYIYLYSNQLAACFDICQKSLEYYKKGMSHAEVGSKMAGYIEQMEIVGELLKIFPYEFNPILPQKKVKIGEKNKKKRKCIYCRGCIADGKTTFREDAHAIPEALGNIKFFQNEECDICNDYFSNNAEEDMGNMLIWNRLQYGMKGKNGYPIFQFGHNLFARYIDGENEDYEKDWGRFEVTKSLIRGSKIKGPVFISTDGEKVSDSIELTYVKDYKPMHIYKTLVKCVIGLIGNDKLTPFSKTIDWLRNDEEYRTLPRIAIVNARCIFMEPELYIFIRKDDANVLLPYCFGELRVLKNIYVFIIPFCEKDRYKFLSDSEFGCFKRILDIMYGKYELQDFSSVYPQKIQQYPVKIKDLKFD